MDISGLGSAWARDFGRALTIRERGSRRQPAAEDPGAALRRLARQIVDLRDGIDTLRRAAATRHARSVSVGAASVASAGGLGLGTRGTHTQLRSTEEISTGGASFTPRQGFASSTASPRIAGTYDGSLGTQTLTFRAIGEGTVGRDTLRFQVRDAAGNTLENVRFSAGGGSPTITLDSGLTFELTEGFVRRHDTFTLDVFADGGGAVAPDNPFSGSGAEGPGFDAGLTVRAGSFLINGVEIEVGVEDTLDSVLQRISTSSADVLASFDAASESVVLTRKTPGQHGITLSDDTSGFLAASKLAGAVAEIGLADDYQSPIAAVAGLAGVQKGSFSVNGITFTIDPATDSLQTVIERVNASAAGVTIAFEPLTDRIAVTATESGRPLVLDGGTSGIWSALRVAEGRHLPTKESGQGRLALVDQRAVRDGLSDLSESLQQLFLTDAGADVGGVARSRIRDSVRDVFRDLVDSDSGDALRSGLGIDFDFEAVDRQVLRIDRARLDDAMSRRVQEFVEFLARDSDEEKGLLEAVDAALARTGEELSRQLDRRADRGLVLDLLA